MFHKMRDPTPRILSHSVSKNQAIIGRYRGSQVFVIFKARALSAVLRGIYVKKEK